MSAAGLLRTGTPPHHWLFAMLCGLVFACGLSAHTHPVPRDIAVIQNFDAARYAGPWFVLARIDHPAEQGLIQTGVYYRSNGDGSLAMVQRGLDPARKQWTKRESLAQPVGAAHQGALKVSTQGAISSDYNVVALDTDYRWALVLGANTDRAWVLSRTPSLRPEDRSGLLQQARAAGVNTEQLLWVPQERQGAPLL
ncbi:lipocalin family protein [Pantoea sp. 18069]|uniref:lipocalin family protein n=1 Tax=Pantoea sp. 18069 TaxID=2681415 RepID=UPI00135AFA43|nr:lipocalin family protein [Pantoea sp. 18069]